MLHPNQVKKKHAAAVSDEDGTKDTVDQDAEADEHMPEEGSETDELWEEQRARVDDDEDEDEDEERGAERTKGWVQVGGEDEADKRGEAEPALFLVTMRTSWQRSSH